MQMLEQFNFSCSTEKYFTFSDNPSTKSGRYPSNCKKPIDYMTSENV
jgi:hypothetical protein